MDRYNAATPPFNGYSSSLFQPTRPGRCTGDAELAVFGAERYFQEAVAVEDATWGALDDSSSLSSSALKTGRDGSVLTPAASSSEASWNSKSGLLPYQPVTGVAAVDKQNSASSLSDTCREKKPSTSGRRRLVGVGCLCASKKSVRVDDGCIEANLHRSPVYTWNAKLDSGSVMEAKEQSTETGKLFPSTASKELDWEEFTTVKVKAGKWNEGDVFLAKTPVLAPIRPEDNRPGKLASKSLDVSSLVQREPETRVLARPIPAIAQIPVATVAENEDAARGARSYLFEPGSTFSASPHPAWQGRRSSGDEEATASEYMHPPSEASVVWSVTTAEGGIDVASVANFSSAASGHYDQQKFQFDNGRLAVTKNSGRRGGRNRSGGLLNSCMCEKAVNVGPSTVPVQLVQQRRVETAGVARLGDAAAVRCRLARG